MDLFYRKYGSGEQKIIILHGFMGQSDHWVPIGKKLAQNYTVYILDQRNHGQSFWDDDFSYLALAEDLHRFIKTHNINNPSIIGHSMGGKVLMQYLVQHPDFGINKPIVIDILPIDYSPNPDIKKMIDLGKNTDISQFSSREEIGNYLEENGIHSRFKKLILKNISLKDGKFSWKINIAAMHQTFDSVFSGISRDIIYPKEIYFIKGAESDLISQDGYDKTLKKFPKAQLLTIENAGHWLHIEKASTLVELLIYILTRDDDIR